MSVTTEHRELRVQDRFQLQNDSQIPVSVEWMAGDKACQCDARIVDLSAGGARLRLAAAVELNDTFEVRLHVKELSIDFRCAVDVCWVRPHENESVLGCAFDGELPEHILRKLACHGFINRRSDKRFRIELSAEVQEELGAHQWSEATIDNYSSGGFRLSSQRRVTIGQRVLLRVKDVDQQPVTIPGRALWQVDSDEGFSIGCSFLNGDGFKRLAAAVGCEKKQIVAKSRRSLRLTPLAWLAFVAVVLVVSQRQVFIDSMQFLWRLFRQ